MNAEGTRDSAATGYVPAEHSSPHDWLRSDHRAGWHAGRFRRVDCPDCSKAGPTKHRMGKDYVEPHDEDVPDSPADVVRQLWQSLNQLEIDRVLPKAIEYGAVDLEIMGFALGRLLNSPNARMREWTGAELQEMACAFYNLGKVARAFGAYAEGRMPNDDCWHDGGVYARMVQIIRERGGWMR